MLEAHGVKTVSEALSGQVALLSEGQEVTEAGRRPVRFQGEPVTVSLGPVRRRTVADSIAVLADGRRVLTERLEEQRVIFPGQSLQVTLRMAPR
jgi:hypothetical protein